MIICPECGEENPQGSKFCRKCGINLVYEEPKVEEEPTVKKVTVETDEGPVKPKSTTTSFNSKKDDGNKWYWCCICIFFLFAIFAILGH
jgi:hypothetical protein